jgi:4,5-dihydroxyphthalate decarboxylase
MQRPVIRLASRVYDGMIPLIRGEVSVPGLDLQVQVGDNVPRVFNALFQGEVDAGEMSLAELIYYKSRDKAEFTAIPVFPSRYFRHGYFFCNTSAGIKSPEDLRGRPIGFHRWVQTAGVWMRGMLAEHYGIPADTTPWYVFSTHHWADSGEEDVHPRDGSVIRRYQTPGVNSVEDTHLALEAREVDVIGVTEVEAPDLAADPRRERLFPDYRTEEIAYYRRTGIFPIMHVLAVRSSVIESHPDLPEQLFQAFVASKRRAQDLMRAIPSWSVIWKDRELEEEDDILGPQAWPFGLAANQHVIDTFMNYCYQQGIAARPLPARELFVPSTWDLTER